MCVLLKPSIISSYLLCLIQHNVGLVCPLGDQRQEENLHRLNRDKVFFLNIPDPLLSDSGFIWRNEDYIYRCSRMFTHTCMCILKFVFGLTPLNALEDSHLCVSPE